MTTYSTREEAELAADKQTLEMLATGTTIDFDGNNCDQNDDTDCDGWDGSDRRCECGNRRVGWSFSEYPKGVWSFYAEAY
jgi:hypothetical protein